MPTRRERTLLEQQRAQQAQRTRVLLIGAGVVAAVIVVALAVMASGVLSQPAPTPAAQSAGATCSAVQSFPSQGQDHIQPNQPHPAYSSNPPTSGWHWDQPRGEGIYSTPQVQEQLVHDLEHGFIVIQYKALSSADLQRLVDLVKRDSHHVILAPDPGLPTEVRVALTAWTRWQTCTGVDENAIRAFTNAFRDKGPEAVP